MSTLLQDLRYSVRLLWNKRAYSITVILMLALGLARSRPYFPSPMRFF
jgi:hypothetical protein